MRLFRLLNAPSEARVHNKIVSLEQPNKKNTQWSKSSLALIPQHYYKIFFLST